MQLRGTNTEEEKEEEEEVMEFWSTVSANRAAE